MTKPIERDPIYRGRRFQTETIELCVRWYITYRLSYRDLAAMMAERGIVVSHTTIMRWVLQYLPEYERRWNRFARPVNSSWRMDETAIRIRGKSSYLYRAVDKHGKSVDSLLREDRGIEAAQAFFRKATATQQSTWPLTITLDGHAASHRALRLLRDEDSRWKNVLVRSCRYLNNIVEQDHRAIKRRCAPMLGFKSVRTAALTLSGNELAHRVHKRQFHLGCGGHGRHSSLKEHWERALARPRLSDPRKPGSQRTNPQLARFDGLRKMHLKPRQQRALPVIVTSVCRERNGRQVAPLILHSPDPPDQLVAIEIRHADIADENVHVLPLDDLQCIRTVLGQRTAASVDHGPGFEGQVLNSWATNETCDCRSSGIDWMLAIPPYSADSRVRFASPPANSHSAGTSARRIGPVYGWAESRSSEMGQSIAEIAERRASTDACLGAERATSTTDDHVRATSARRMLDDLIERDRIIADIKLSKFRDGADRTVSRVRSDASVVSPGISDERNSADHQIKVERDMADATLLRERKRSDVAVDVERQEHDALRVDMETMRQATDDRLSSERQGADSTSDALGQTRTALILAQSGNGRANEVLAMVSHDLRSPLSVISLNTESIVEKSQEPATRAAANTVMQGISRMERLLCDLLDMARIESGTLNIVRRQHDIGALLREVLQIYEPMFVSRNITFTVDIPPQSVEAFFDHDRIVQVLSNLLGNAMKFTPGGGVVALRAERQANHVVFALHNDGAGISPSALPHIFERFWQLDSNERRGLGLGLNICRAIVSAHGGQIWAESEVGRGAMFRFTLPVR